MQRQTRIEKIIHPTKLEITMSHNFKGHKETPTEFGGTAHNTGFELYNYEYNPTSNLELFTCFQQMAIACGPASEYNYEDITKRETEIKVNGVINGKKVVDQVFYGLVDFARFLKKYDVDVMWIEAMQQEKLEKKIAKKKPVESNLTDLHVRGFLNGDKLNDNEVRNTAELLNVLNAHTKGAKFRVVKDDEVVLTKDQVAGLEATVIKSRLFDLMMRQSVGADYEESVANPQSSVRVEDITDSEPGDVITLRR